MCYCRANNSDMGREKVSNYVLVNSKKSRQKKTAANSAEAIQCLQKNSGYSTAKIVAEILNGSRSYAELDLELSPTDIANLRYAPLVSCEFEQSFSKYKATLRENRQSFKFETLKKHLVISCNQ